MFLEKLRSFSFPSNSKNLAGDEKKHNRCRVSLRTPNSEHKNPLSPSTTRSTHGSRISHPKMAINAEVTDISKENNGNNEDQEGRDFREYLEKSRKAEEAEEKRRKKMAAIEKKRKEVNLSPWASRM